VTESTAEERPPENQSETIVEPEAKPTPVPDAEVAEAGTPGWVLLVYTLGGLAGIVFVASIVFVVLANVGNGGGVDISVPSLVVWLAIALVAVVTFIRRRSGRSR
jgi:hypothetical protein